MRQISNFGTDFSGLYYSHKYHRMLNLVIHKLKEYFGCNLHHNFGLVNISMIMALTVIVYLNINFTFSGIFCFAIPALESY